MPDSKKKNPTVTGDVLEYIRERASKDPALATKIDEEYNWIQLVRRIRHLREACHLSQEELAQRVGTKQPAIARLESGRVIPRLDLLYKIAAALDMRLDVSFVPRTTTTPRQKDLRVRSR
ncbi:MAG TPA: helix-turn-helix transcriptional regulator [Polyangia bacterium]|jgi:DNA-binding XRE family transcriptional regulator|nr:helix-turn-helix transcriptional regulator [Polyangia bacterium]